MSSTNSKARQPISLRRRRIELCASAAVAAIVLGVTTAGAQSYNATHQTLAGDAYIADSIAGVTDVSLNTSAAVIQWNVPAGSGTYNFQPSGTTTFHYYSDFSVLNVVNIEAARAIRFNGTTNSLIGSATGGTVWFYSPGGIVIGTGARFNVGSLLLTTSAPVDQTANFNSGTASFGTASNAAAAISIESGASITASNYVAMLAPHIDQAGTVRAGGEIAYIAGEAANLTFPTGSGLFSIAVTTGTDAADAQGRVIVHSGTSAGPGATANTPDRGIYFVAVPKNTAITTLLGGTIGYDAASGAATTAEGIYLVGGGVIENGHPYSNTDYASLPGFLDETPTNLTIASGARFLQDVTGYATNISTQASTSDISFAKSATLTGTLTNTLAVAAGHQLTTGGSLSLYAHGYDSSNFDLIGGTVTATVGGTLNVGGSTTAATGLLLNASSSAPPEVDPTGGSVTLALTGGTVIAGTNGIALAADGTGGEGFSNDGGAGIGGAATLSLSGAISTGGQISLSARGIGGNTQSGRAGDGTGGIASLTAAPGFGVTTSSITASGLSIAADGTGGTGYCSECTPTGALGGNGVGGSATAALTDTNISVPDFALTASGTAGSSMDGQYPSQPGKGGDGSGGLARATFVRGTLAVTNGISVSADGTGGDGGDAIEGSDGSVTTSGSGGNGGSGTGGRTADGHGASITFSGSTLFAGEGIPAITVTANGQGGAGGYSDDGIGGNGGFAVGGNASYTQDQAASVGADLQLSASATGGNGGGNGVLLSHSSGGDSLGGSVNFSASGGGSFDGSLSISAFTEGGFGGGQASDIPGFHGTMQGGTSSTTVDGTAVTLSLYASATDSSSASEGGDQYRGAYTAGGNTSISVTGGGSFTTDLLTIDTSAIEIGGDAGGADGVAGAVTIQAASGASISSGTTTITGEALGGRGGAGNGGTGRGGTIQIQADSAAIDLGTASIDASGGTANDAPAARAGIGGSIAVTARNGGTFNAGGLSLDSRGLVYADNNAATGGSITLTADGGRLTVGDLTARSSGNLQSHAGTASGGSIAINATGSPALSRPSSFGDTILQATGTTTSGTISIRNDIAGGSAPLSFGALSATTQGTTTDPVMQIVSIGSAITANSATLETEGGLYFASVDNGTFAVAGDLFANARLYIQTDLGGGATPTVQADNIGFVSPLFNGLGNSIVKANTNLSIVAADQLTARTLIAGNSIYLSSRGDITLDSATVTNAGALSDGALDPSVSRLEINSGYRFSVSEDGFIVDTTGAGNITINTAATAGGTALLRATRDINVGSGANVRSDNALTLSAGDDIIVGASARVTGAANPIDGSTGSATLVAGDGTGPAEVHSFINFGTVTATAAALSVRADAIQSGGSLGGGTVLAYLNNGSAAGDDSGTLAPTCTAGNLCIGGISATGPVDIGTQGRIPVVTRIAGNVTGSALDVRSTGGIVLGGSVPATINIGGTANFDAGTQSLSDLGTVSIQAGSIAVTAANDIAASGTSFRSTGDIALAVGRNIVAADLIAGGGLGPGHIGLTGQLTVSGQISAGTGGVDVTAPGGITLNRVIVGDTTPLTLDSGSAALTIADASASGAARAGTVSLHGGTITVGKLAASGTVDLAGSSAVSVTTDLAAGPVTVSGSDVELVSAVGPLNVASATSTGNIALTSGGALTLTSATAGDATTLAAGTGGLIVGASASRGAFAASSGGAINYGSITASGATLTATGDMGVGTLDVGSTGIATLTAGGALAGTGQFVTASEGLSLAGGSIDLTTPGALALSSITASAGDLRLTSGGALTIARGSAAGNATLAAPTAVVLGSFANGGNLQVTGAAIRFNGIASGGASLTATAGDITGGTMTVAGTAALRASGAIRLADAVRTGLATQGNPVQQGLNDSLGNGGDLLVDAGGDIVLADAVAGGRASLTGGGGVAIGQLRSGGDLTVLSVGDIGFTSLAGNAMSLSSRTGGVSGGALAASYTTNLSAAGLLQVTNLSSADLVTGRGRSITLRGTSPLAIASLISGGAISVIAGGLTVNGAIQGSVIDLGSTSIAIAPTARIGTAGTTTAVTFRNVGTGRSFIGASGTGYSLAAAGLARVQADAINLILPQAAGSSPALPDVVIGDVTLHGTTGTATGTLANLTAGGSFALQTPGRVQVVGKLLLTDIAAGNSATITAGQAIDIVSPTGGLSLTDTAGAAQGTLTLVAPRVTAASAQTINDLAGLTTLSQRDARLGRNDGAVNDQGYVVGGHLVFRIADALDIQNSGGSASADRRGVTAGSAGIDVVATGSITPEVVINGRQAAAGGGFTAGLDLLPLVKFTSAVSIVNAGNAATINGCTPTSCLAPAPMPTGMGLAFGYVPLVPTPQDLAHLLAHANGTAQILPDATRPLLATSESSPFSFAPVVDEPVVGIGTEAIGTSNVAAGGNGSPQNSGVSMGTDRGDANAVPQNGSISTGPDTGSGVPQNGNLSTGPSTGDGGNVPPSGGISAGPVSDGASGTTGNGAFSSGPADGNAGHVDPTGRAGSGAADAPGASQTPRNDAVGTGPANSDRATATSPLR